MFYTPNGDGAVNVACLVRFDLTDVDILLYIQYLKMIFSLAVNIKNLKAFVNRKMNKIAENN